MHPNVLQVIACVVLVVAGAIWFWGWCLCIGLREGRKIKMAGITDEAARTAQMSVVERWDRRASVGRRYLLVAISTMIVGLLVLIL